MEHKKFKHALDKSGDCADSGFSCEEQFKLLAEKRGYEVRAASKSEQFSHIDFWLEKDGNRWSFDCKARKKLRREDIEPTDEFCWLEFVSVNGGVGWLRGLARYICFERENDFFIVDRKLLLELAERIVDFNTIVDRPHKALRKIYRRFKRKDQISYIEFVEIEKLEHKLWKKNQEDQN